MEKYKFTNMNEDVLRIIQSKVLMLEKKNEKTHEKTDAAMVDEIIKIVKAEVDRKFR